MNNFYIKQSPLTGMVGYGGGSTGLTLTNPASAKWYGDRGIAAGGGKNWNEDASRNKKVIEYVSISTGSDTSDFGDLLEGGQYGGGVSNGVLGVIYCANNNTSWTTQIDYITIANTGNASDFGDSTLARVYGASLSDGLRGVWVAGQNQSEVRTNTIDYVTLESASNASDFGDTAEITRFNAAMSDGTKGVHGGGQESSSSAYVNRLSYITVQSTGNTSDFGDLTNGRTQQTGGGDTTRGVFMGGRTGNATVDDIDYITVQTTGNATDFGDLNQDMKNGQHGQVGNDVRAMLMGGEDENTGGAAYVNKIQYITVQTTGNGSDFGNLLQTDRGKQGCAGD